MLLFNPNKQNLDEVVFENRNKAYGAYALRKAYASRVNKSLLFTLLPFVFLLAVTISQHPIKNLGDFFPDTPKAPNQPKSSGGGYVDLSSGFDFELENVEFEIVPDKRIAQKKVKKEEVKKVVAQVIQSIGSTGQATASMGGSIGLPGLPGIGTGGGLPTLGGNEGAEIFDPNNVGVMAEYPGGIQAMYEYIGKHLVYPSLARENAKEGKVVLSFVIDAKGKVSMSEVERGIGFGCDEEALRVINKMPNWTPASQNGKPVAVRLLLPVVFRLQ
jgi:periplasmic protein TonB